MEIVMNLTAYDYNLYNMSRKKKIETHWTTLKYFITSLNIHTYSNFYI